MLVRVTIAIDVSELLLDETEVVEVEVVVLVKVITVLETSELLLEEESRLLKLEVDASTEEPEVLEAENSAEELEVEENGVGDSELELEEEVSDDKVLEVVDVEVEESDVVELEVERIGSEESVGSRSSLLIVVVVGLLVLESLKELEALGLDKSEA